MYSQSALTNIRILATRYARAKGMSIPAVSRKIYGNVQFLPAFLNGHGSVSVRVADELIHRFSEAWPDNVPWPQMVNAIITRPRLKKRPQS